ncbi:MAG: lipid II flippase MurJ [Microthrixaceae bacterium]
MTGERSVVRSATGMGAAAALSRVIGGVRVLVIAAILGTTYLGNAFQSSNTVSNLLFELLAAGALSAVLVPGFVARLDSGDREGAEHLAGELLGVTLLVLGAVSVVGVVAAPWIADFLTTAVEDPSVAEAQRDLTAFLLVFFIPQVVLYGLGAIATAVLHARRSFVLPAVAPIGNTVVLVGFLVAFRVVAGADPGLDLDTGEKVLLGLGGTLGVVAFVAVPTVGVWRGGFRLRPLFTRTHEELGSMLRLSGWASLQHASAAVLLAAAIVAGSAVEGGVVAYQVGWFFFLAPYGIIAQPIHTTILPEMTSEHRRGDMSAFTDSLRWGLGAMAVLLVPLSASAWPSRCRHDRARVRPGQRRRERRPAQRSTGVPRGRPVALRGVLPARPGLVRARRLAGPGARRGGSSRARRGHHGHRGGEQLQHRDRGGPRRGPQRRLRAGLGGAGGCDEAAPRDLGASRVARSHRSGFGRGRPCRLGAVAVVGTRGPLEDRRGAGAGGGDRRSAVLRGDQVDGS